MEEGSPQVDNGSSKKRSGLKPPVLAWGLGPPCLLLPLLAVYAFAGLPYLAASVVYGGCVAGAAVFFQPRILWKVLCCAAVAAFGFPLAEVIEPLMILAVMCLSGFYAAGGGAVLFIKPRWWKVGLYRLGRAGVGAGSFVLLSYFDLATSGCPFGGGYVTGVHKTFLIITYVPLACLLAYDLSFFLLRSSRFQNRAD